MSISILILTFNEEKNIEAALQSVAGFDEVIVLDSFSSDSTVTLSKSLGARVYQRVFDNYAAQRTYGLDEIDYKNNWVLMLDADERMTPELESEIKTTIEKRGSEFSLFRMRRKDIFYGKWIKRSSGYPTWFGRLVKRGEVTINREINEEYLTEGKVAQLDNHLLHFPFNKGISWWFERHNRYSSMEAEEKVKRSIGISLNAITGLLTTDPVRRRKCLKQIVYSMPCRPLIVFFALYVIKGGFLDGVAGFRFCILKAIYEYLIDCKVNEIKRRQADLPI